MDKKLLTAGVAFAAIALSTLTFAGVKNALPKKADFSAVKTAVETNNYAALSATVKAKITEAQFAKMVAHDAERSAEEKALIAGDYTAFRNAKIAQIPDEAEFRDMVAVRAAHTTALAAIETAIKNNDFAAFQKAHADLKAALVALNPDMPGISDVAPDAKKMEQRFNQLVTKYQKNGTLPKNELGKGLFMMGHGNDMKQAGKGGNKGNKQE